MSLKALGDYTVIKQIGQGSLGTVYLAEHRYMKRQHVLKVLPKELAGDRAFIARFEEEVKQLATLEHPHIVKIHNVSYDQGLYFLVTDCVVDSIGESTNLSQYVSTEGRLSEEELLAMLRQIADALDYAHEKAAGEGALIHRGLKPSNILVGRERSGLQFTLSDFGLSKVIGVGSVLTRLYATVAEALGIEGVSTGAYTAVEGKKLTQLHQSFLQSYTYLAPEQKRIIEGTPVTARADMYAFGVLAYWMITGKLPEGVFPMPSEVVPDWKLDWDALVQGCLQSDPAKRPECLLDILDEVEQGVRVPLKAVEAPVARAQQLVKAKPLVAPVVPAKLEPPRVTLPFEHTPQVTPYRPEPKEVKNVEPIMTDEVVIPAGTYIRGSNGGSRDEMPCHKIHVDSFAIDVHPVTNEQFALFLEYMGGEKGPDYHDLLVLKESRIRKSGGRMMIESGYSKHPVVGVTWYGAVAYASWVGKRLPTEAEWEIAAKGGEEGHDYATGDRIEKSQANFFSSDTTAVKSYPPNGYDLYDMSGNVYEWCQDWYEYNYYDVSAQEPDNPMGPHQGVYRVLRGGCWKSLTEDLRTSHRHRNNPGTANSTYGFRCARSAA
ncbi:MAG: SUMF1/EgtB/PvdO family nonheme iron enzyme [Parachlamydiales bacterium]